MKKRTDAVGAALRLERAKESIDSHAYGRALDLLKNPMPAGLTGERDFLVAEALRAQGFLARAALLYKNLLKRVSDPSAKIEACLALAACLRSLGQTQQARRVWQIGHKTAVRFANRGLLERLDLEKILILRASGDFHLSLKLLKKSESRLRRAHDWAGAAYVLWAMGGALRFSGNLAGSRKAFLESLRLARRAQDKTGAVYALFGLGGTTRIQGRLAEAQRHYAAALQAAKGTEDLFGQAYAHCGLANVLRQRGKSAEAERHYLQAHGLYRLLGDPVDLAYVDWGLGQIYMRRRDLKAAEKKLRLAREGFRQGTETRGIVLCEMSLSSILHARGRTSEAEKLFNTAWRRARQAGIHTHLEIFT